MIAIVIIFFVLASLAQLRALCTLIVDVNGKSKISNIDQRKIHAITLPKILVQVPVYNEGWEVKDAALGVMRLDYPRERICLQIIDDSPVQWPDLVQFLQQEAEKAGIGFQYLYRPSRKGYKSGALNYGLLHCDHPYVVVLDADFVLQPDFLQRTVPLLSAVRTAGVQTRWHYRNRFASPTVTIQSTIFETIFALEQSVRDKLGIPAFFTGTAAIIKRQCIEEIGGWREEPFTAEDIDLSFRAYNKGYRFRYLDEDLSGCEATPNYISFRKQQQRWARGVFQAGIDNIAGILPAPQPVRSKLMEISTVLYNFFPLVMFLLAVSSSVYLLAGLERTNTWKTIQWISGIAILLGPVPLGMFFAVRKYNRLSSREYGNLLTGILLGMNLVWSIIPGIWEVISQSKKEFVVTPKGLNAVAVKKRSFSRKSLWIGLPELLSVCYFGGIVVTYGKQYPESVLLCAVPAASALIAGIAMLQSKITSTKKQMTLIKSYS